MLPSNKAKKMLNRPNRPSSVPTVGGLGFGGFAPRDDFAAAFAAGNAAATSAGASLNFNRMCFFSFMRGS